MTTEQLVSGIVLIVILVGAAGWFAWRQGVALRRLRSREHELSGQEISFHRRQVTRRLLCSGLMGVLAVLLAGALIFLEGPTQRIVETGITNDKEREMFKAYGAYWIAFLLILFGLLVLAGADFFATRRHGLRQWKQLQADRKAMIDREVREMRERRRGEME